MNLPGDNSVMNTRQVIQELLGQLGSSREAREYLKRFSDVSSSEFAVIKVGGQVLQDDIDELASALNFLYVAGLYPIVVHGAGPQLDQALKEAGIATEKLDGLRVTTPEVLAVARDVIYQQNLALVDSLEKIGVRARSVQQGVFHADLNQNEKLGLVGEVSDVNLFSIRSAINAKSIPIVTCLGETRSGQVLNINADIAVNALVNSIQPFKVIFLTGTGGLLNDQSEVISAIQLTTDYERIINADWVHSGMSVKMQQIKQLLDGLPDTASVSITSAKNLTRELFTHTGAGTLIRKGELLTASQSLDDAGLEQLARLIETCFEKAVATNWFEKLKLKEVIWSESWRAAAVIDCGIDGVAYLDKFVVTPDAQGEGIGSALWKEIKARHPQLYWRSRRTNKINQWYLRQADYSWRSGKWMLFGYGIEDFSMVDRCVADSLQRNEYWNECETEQ